MYKRMRTETYLVMLCNALIIASVFVTKDPILSIIRLVVVIVLNTTHVLRSRRQRTEIIQSLCDILKEKERRLTNDVSQGNVDEDTAVLLGRLLNEEIEETKRRYSQSYSKVKWENLQPVNLEEIRHHCKNSESNRG